MLLKKELNGASGIDTSSFSAKSNSIVLKPKTDKLDIKKWVNVPTALNNFKIKVDDLDTDKLKTLPVELEKRLMQ